MIRRFILRIFIYRHDVFFVLALVGVVTNKHHASSAHKFTVLKVVGDNTNNGENNIIKNIGRYPFSFFIHKQLDNSANLLNYCFYINKL